jgi:hypothetical protein
MSEGSQETVRCLPFQSRTLSEYPLLAQDRQQENGGTTNHFKESSVEASVDTDPAIKKSIVSNDSGVVSMSVHSAFGHNSSSPAHTCNCFTPLEATEAIYTA